MGDHQVDVVGSQPGAFEYPCGRCGNSLDGDLEDGLSLEVETVDLGIVSGLRLAHRPHRADQHGSALATVGAQIHG